MSSQQGPWSNYTIGITPTADSPLPVELYQLDVTARRINRQPCIHRTPYDVMRRAAHFEVVTYSDRALAQPD